MFMFTLMLFVCGKLQIEAPYGNRISFVAVKLLKDSVSETPAYRPFSLTPKSDNHFGMECNRIIPTSHRHSNRLASALLTVCLLRLPPLGSWFSYPRGIVARTLLFQPLTYRITDCTFRI